MIVGRGLIAKAFTNNCLDDVIIFASGVSNSKALDETLFKKEIDLLNSVIAENNDSKKLVYFSSYSIDNAEEKNRRIY